MNPNRKEDKNPSLRSQMDLPDAYFALGWRVIPLRGKAPFIEGWQNSKLDKEEFNAKYGQGDNVGIVTGWLNDETSLIALDVDEPDLIGFNPQVWLDRGAMAHTTRYALRIVFYTDSNEVAKFSRKVTVKPEDLTEEQKALLGKGKNRDVITIIEVLGEGRQFMAPPSTHPETGQRLEWVKGPCGPEEAFAIHSLSELRDLLNQSITRNKWVLEELFETSKAEAEGDTTLLAKWLEQIKARLNVAGEGPNYIYAHCPFHKPDSQPSFVIHKSKFYAFDYHDEQVYNLKSLAKKLEVSLPVKIGDEGVAKYFDADGRFVPALLAKELMGEYHFITMRDNEAMYVWCDGCYRPYAESLIKEECKARLGEEYRINRVSEVIDYIKASTFRDRREEAPNLIPLKNGVLVLDTMELKPHSPDYMFFNLLPDKALWRTGTFKMLTGRDLIAAERKFQNSFTFENYAKLLFSANKVPEAYDDTDAFFRRWLIIVFPNEFVGDKADPNILQKLTTPEELSGLLNLALPALKRLLKKGLFSYSKTTEEIREDYIRKSSPIAAFVMDCLEVDSDAFIIKKDLFALFAEYCRARKIPAVGQDTFFKNLPKHVTITDFRPVLFDGRPPALRGIRLNLSASRVFDPLSQKEAQNEPTSTPSNASRVFYTLIEKRDLYEKMGYKFEGEASKEYIKIGITLDGVDALDVRQKKPSLNERRQLTLDAGENRLKNQTFLKPSIRHGTDVPHVPTSGVHISGGEQKTSKGRLSTESGGIKDIGDMDKGLPALSVGEKLSLVYSKSRELAKDGLVNKFDVADSLQGRLLRSEVFQLLDALAKEGKLLAKGLEWFLVV